MLHRIFFGNRPAASGPSVAQIMAAMQPPTPILISKPKIVESGQKPANLINP